MKFITGFFMAWGNFLAFPCPFKRWDEDLKNYMLGFLPTVGLILGGLWSGLCIFLVWIGTPFFVLTFAMTFLLPALCGFLHMDGFMDCCDAILSRRAPEEKQRILKDSACGAFAVLGALFMILGYFACLATALGSGVDFIELWSIPVASRSAAGISVLLGSPMAQSQYACGKGADNKGQKKKIAALTFMQMIIFCGVGLIFAVSVEATLLVMASTAAGSFIAAALAKRSLGGMNGDIAGFGIVWGEFAGIFAMLIL